MVCPNCKRAFNAEESPALPFCSRRCREIDLGRWLNEGYSVPVVKLDEDDESELLPEDA